MFAAYVVLIDSIENSCWYLHLIIDAFDVVIQCAPAQLFEIVLNNIFD